MLGQVGLSVSEISASRARFAGDRIPFRYMQGVLQEASWRICILTTPASALLQRAMLECWLETPFAFLPAEAPFASPLNTLKAEQRSSREPSCYRRQSGFSGWKLYNSAVYAGLPAGNAYELFPAASPVGRRQEIEVGSVCLCYDSADHYTEPVSVNIDSLLHLGAAIHVASHNRGHLQTILTIIVAHSSYLYGRNLIYASRRRWREWPLLTSTVHLKPTGSLLEYVRPKFWQIIKINRANDTLVNTNKTYSALWDWLQSRTWGEFVVDSRGGDNSTVQYLSARRGHTSVVKQTSPPIYRLLFYDHITERGKSKMKVVKKPKPKRCHSTPLREGDISTPRHPSCDSVVLASGPYLRDQATHDRTPE
ncbi:uncharacterized protein CLUP02_17280 [Colletotrichum lupini]|uniref:Uncharacterized protein n=1 Tax=Colletotrichum lupini TaxID=145971 RepID=A0A9Q8WAM3_9PEZI|nr:uncharacterized protein CLUP02_17280 [Colletotrichum lupini]UQC75772.1 hypothetical protein CLUP02_17280 [Colletotrichum lupini]